MGMHGGLQAAVESLNLTEDQKAKVKDIFAEAKAKHQAVSSDTTLSDDPEKGQGEGAPQRHNGQAERSADT